MAASTQEFKILVADDSRLYRKLVEETLAQEQYNRVEFAGVSKLGDTVV